MLTNAVSNRLRETGRLEHERYLRRPRSVRIDSEFRLFIPDYESYRIQVYQKDQDLLVIILEMRTERQVVAKEMLIK